MICARVTTGSERIVDRRPPGRGPAHSYVTVTKVRMGDGCREMTDNVPTNWDGECLVIPKSAYDLFLSQAPDVSLDDAFDWEWDQSSMNPTNSSGGTSSTDAKEMR